MTEKPPATVLSLRPGENGAMGWKTVTVDELDMSPFSTASKLEPALLHQIVGPPTLGDDTL